MQTSELDDNGRNLPQVKTEQCRKLMTETITELDFVHAAYDKYIKLAEIARSTRAFEADFIINSDKKLHIRIHADTLGHWYDIHTVTDDFGVNLKYIKSLKWNLNKLDEFIAGIAARYNKHYN